MKKKTTKRKPAKPVKPAKWVKPVALPYGWECPCCHVIYAPNVDRCFCQSQRPQEPTIPPEIRREFEEMVRRQTPQPRPMTWDHPHYPWWHPLNPLNTQYSMMQS